MMFDEEKDNGETEVPEASSTDEAAVEADGADKAKAEDTIEPDKVEAESAAEPDAASEPEPEKETASEPEAEASEADESTAGAAEDATASKPNTATESPSTARPPTRKKHTPEDKVARRAARKRRRVEARPAERKPIVRLPKPEQERAARKERVGLVVGDAMDRTITVKVERAFPHRRYGKVIRRTTKFYAHDAENSASVGDRVRIVETRPISKNKRWRLAEIVETAK
jgi:small subunit ribosomal protein S17